MNGLTLEYWWILYLVKRFEVTISQSVKQSHSTLKCQTKSFDSVKQSRSTLSNHFVWHCHRTLFTVIQLCLTPVCRTTLFDTRLTNWITSMNSRMSWIVMSWHKCQTKLSYTRVSNKVVWLCQIKLFDSVEQLFGHYVSNNFVWHCRTTLFDTVERLCWTLSNDFIWYCQMTLFNT